MMDRFCGVRALLAFQKLGIRATVLGLLTGALMSFK